MTEQIEKKQSKTEVKMSKLRERMVGASIDKHSAVLTDSKIFNDTEACRTRVPILNLALSGTLDGGLSSGLTMIAGPSKHFKSNLALIMVAAYLRKHPDSVCVFFDNEFGTTPDYFKAAGIDPERVIHAPFMNIEELKFDAIKKLEEVKRGDKVVFYIDSVGNAASKKEVEDAKDEKSVSDMTRAKQLKSLFRMVTPYLTMLDIPMVCINHTYQTQEMYAKTVVSGGCVVEDTMITLADGTKKAVQDIQVGEYLKTMVGHNVVTHTWNPDTLEVGEPDCYEIEFMDGYKVTCSDTHRFLVMQKDIPTWVEAKDLVAGMDCVIV
ncbi:MAG: recombinase RecA [Culicoidibacterales bacterium]